MRLIGSFSTNFQARKLEAYLKARGITVSCEPSFEGGSDPISYEIWAHDEDRLKEAADAYEELRTNPESPAFQIPLVEESSASLPSEESATGEFVAPRFFPTWLSSFFLILCSGVFFLNSLQEIAMQGEDLSERSVFLTPIQSLLLIDLPAPIAQLEKVLEKYALAPNQKVETLPPEAVRELEQIDQIPFWKGFYPWLTLQIQTGDPTSAEGPLFERIRQGEVWRLFSPAILHTQLLHILFNMIWLWVLCRPIEQRVGSFRLLLLILITGIGSNVIQYLMTGPFFLGFSGVVMGLAGFIWTREKLAPWEGYPISRGTLLFLTL